MGEGGGIFAAGPISIENSTISYNTASSGGGLYVFGTATISSTAVSYNTATAGHLGQGVGIYNNEVLDMTGGSISHNSSASGGAGGGLLNNFAANLEGTLGELQHD